MTTINFLILIHTWHSNLPTISPPLQNGITYCISVFYTDTEKDKLWPMLPAATFIFIPPALLLYLFYGGSLLSRFTKSDAIEALEMSFRPFPKSIPILTLPFSNLSFSPCSRLSLSLFSPFFFANFFLLKCIIILIYIYLYQYGLKTYILQLYKLEIRIAN